MDPPSSSSSNTRNYNINNINNNNQDNPLSFLIPTYATPPPPTTTTSYVPNYNPDSNITANPTATRNTSPSSSSHPPPPPPSRGSSKKRTRASRRAPTTVLSTDTSNFRAMVQEFTGFPSPPFPSNSSPSIHSFNHLFSRSSSFPTTLHPNLTTSTAGFSPSSILHAMASSNTTPITAAAATTTYPPNMLMFNNATPSSISNLTHIAGGGSSVHVQGLGHNVASTQFGDLGRVLAGASNNGDPDRCTDDDDSSTREDKRRKSVLDSWNDHL